MDILDLCLGGLMKTKFNTALIAFAVLCFSLAAQADFGLGLIIGSPTGISAKLSQGRDNAFDAAMAWDLGGDHFHIHADYLWLKNAGVRLDKVALDWYFGIGGRLVLLDNDNRRRDDDDYRLGVRAPIGIGYTFKDPRIEVFGELALILNLIESTSIDIDGGIGARFHF